MADEIIPAAEVVAPTQEQQIAEQMNFRLNGEQPAAQATSEQPVIVAQPAETIVDANEYLKTTLGYDSWEVAKAEIEELRQLKLNPPTSVEKYENEQSELLAKAFRAGKVDDVYKYISEQRQLDNLISAEVNKDSADSIIKLGMQLEFKDLSPDEINYKFNKTYGIPKKPEQALTETEADFEERVNEWNEKVLDIETGKIIDAKTVKPKLASAKQNLVLPTIETAVDQDYLQYKKDLEDAPRLAAESSEAYKTFTPDSLETKIPFIDEPNKINFEFQFKPDQESFNKAIEFVSNPNSNNPFANQDGTPNRQKVLDALYFGLNKEKLLMEAMKQAKNATIKAMLPDNSNSGMGQRQMPSNQEPSELHKNMQLAGVVT